MAPQLFWRILKQHAIWFLLIPLLTAATVFFLTRNEKRTYKSQATLYTGIASGYNIFSDQKDGYQDYSAIANAFDNLLTTLNSNESFHQIGVNLLARHLQLERPDSLVLSNANFEALGQAVPADFRRSLLAGASTAGLRTRVDSLARSRTANPIKTLMNDPTTFYSKEYIGKKLKANRKNTSDMLEMEYEASDPAVAQQTLQEAITILNDRYTSLRSSETNPVIGYYENKAAQAKQKLDEAESRLRSFSVQHEVLNFDEEAKNIAFSRETMINDYNQELMRNKAAKAALDALKGRMGQRGNLLEINAELKTKQNELAEAEGRLLNARVNNLSTAAIAQLQARVNQVAEELKVLARRYYAAGDSPESVPQSTLVNDWLTKVIEFEESTARLSVYQKRLREYAAKTAEYSPLGSQLREMNRNLTVAEKEYLSLVESVNQARARRQDLTIDQTLKVLDPPQFPYSPQSSKRLIFIAAALAVGFFIALVLVALRFWLDRRISSPEQAESLIGRPIVAEFPTVKKFAIESRTSRTAVSMFEQLCNAINIEIAQVAAKRSSQPIITLVSIRSKQGKTWMAHGLTRLYAQSGQRIAYCYPRFSEQDRNFEQNGLSFFPYAIRPDFMNISEVEELLDLDPQFKLSRFDKVVIELPALISSPIPVFLLKQSFLSVLVIDANTVWGRTEKQLLGMYAKVANHAILPVLNRVEGDLIEAPTVADAEHIMVQHERLLEPQRNQV